MASQDGSEHNERPPQPPKRVAVTELARKRLQKCFEHAGKQTSQENYDYATELLTQCVLGDPGNLVYLQNYMGNLHKKYGNNKKGSSLAQFKERGARSALKKAMTQSEWDEVIKNGIAILKVNPWDVPTLTSMATACTAIAGEGEGTPYAGYSDCELFYLKCAVEASPKDAEVCKQLAVALGKRHRFDEAIAFWHRVEQARPGDEEAARAIASLAVEKTIVKGGWDENEKKVSGNRAANQQQTEEELTPEERLKRRIARQPDDLPGYHELAQLYLQANRYTDAEEVFKKALKVSGNDPELAEKIEDVQIRHLRLNMIAAEKKAKETGKEADKVEFERLRKDIITRELDINKRRCERYPGNLSFRYEVGIRYQLLGQYNEAIKEFQAARNDPRRRGVCMLCLGECFQYIKQYRLAMQHYQAAIQEIPDRDADNKKKALYRAGKLAIALKEKETAEKHLTVLAALDFTYRDVSKLLDGLGAE